MTRPLVRAEISAQNSRKHMENQRDAFIAKHGEQRGTLYFLGMLLQTVGRKALNRGDQTAFLALVHDLNAIYNKHTQ
jgi:hypothetical protein